MQKQMTGCAALISKMGKMKVSQQSYLVEIKTSPYTIKSLRFSRHR